MISETNWSHGTGLGSAPESDAREAPSDASAARSIDVVSMLMMGPFACGNALRESRELRWSRWGKGRRVARRQAGGPGVRGVRCKIPGEPSSAARNRPSGA